MALEKNITQKKLVIFMPSIEGGGVEKNLFIISNYLSTKLKKVYILTANYDQKKNFDSKILFLIKNTNRWQKYGRLIKTTICLWYLFLFWIKNKNFSILSFQANIYVILFSTIFKIKIISRSNSAPEGWSKNFLKKIVFKNILNKANKIIVNSYDFKKSLRKYFNLNSICIYNPLDSSRINSLSKKKIKFNWFGKTRIRIINIARFTNQKDHLTLLKLVEKISKKLNVKLLIIGRGKNKALMLEYIRKNNLQKIIKIISFKKNPYPYLKLANLFILTSNFEGLPNVLLEAMQLKKYIISTNCPTGPREILKNGKLGSLAPIGDVSSLSKFVFDFNLKKKVINNKINEAFKSLKRFNYENNLNKYYKTVIKIL